MIEPTTVMGFDYGTKRIGVAIGKTELKIASPLKIIPVTKGEPDWKNIQDLVTEWKVDAFVVGIPLNMNETEQAITKKARDFIDELKKRFRLNVYEVDERLTTKEVKRHVFDEAGYKGLRKTPIDSLAAKVILEDWFIQHRG